MFPELSRTFHAGSAGVHVTGFEQESVFNRMIFNQEPEVELEDVREWVISRVIGNNGDNIEDKDNTGLITY